MSMKFFAVTSIMIVFCSVLNAQTSVVNPLQNNTLIKGIPNHLSVGLKGIEADSIELSANHSTLQKINNWYWTIIPDTGYSSETIIVTAWRKGEAVSIDSTEFRLRWLPDPVIYVGNKTGLQDSITRTNLTTTLGVAARGIGIDQDVHYAVISFNMILEGPYLSLALHSDNAYLTEGMRNAIMTAPVGQRVTFSGINVKYPDGRVKKVEGVSLLLKAN